MRSVEIKKKKNTLHLCSVRWCGVNWIQRVSNIIFIWNVDSQYLYGCYYSCWAVTRNTRWLEPDVCCKHYWHENESGPAGECVNINICVLNYGDATCFRHVPIEFFFKFAILTILFYSDFKIKSSENSCKNIVVIMFKIDFKYTKMRRILLRI